MPNLIHFIPDDAPKHKDGHYNAACSVPVTWIGDPMSVRYPNRGATIKRNANCPDCLEAARAEDPVAPVGVRGVTSAERRDRQAKNRRSRYPSSRRVARGEG